MTRKFLLSILALTLTAGLASAGDLAKAANPKYSLLAKQGAGFKYTLANTGAGLQVFQRNARTGRPTATFNPRPARNPQPGPYGRLGNRTPAAYYAGKAKAKPAPKR